MENIDDQIISLGTLRPGERMEINNVAKKAQRYTFECGEYGKISFDLIIGGAVTFTAGSVAPKIMTSDID